LEKAGEELMFRKAWDYINLSKNPMYAYKKYEKKESYMIEI
jgi:hypothetical protein